MSLSTHPGRLAATVVALLAGTAGVAGAKVLLQPDDMSTKAIQLDSDAADERVAAQGRELGDTGFVQNRVVIEDDCGDSFRRYALTSYQDSIAAESLQADGRGTRLEILATGTSGASGRAQVATLARLSSGGPESRCGNRLGVLFRYPSKSTARKAPKGYKVSGAFTTVRNASKRYPGREVRLSESLVDDDDAFCCPSKRRVTMFRYSAKSKRYVRYSTRVVSAD